MVPAASGLGETLALFEQHLTAAELPVESPEVAQRTVVRRRGSDIIAVVMVWVVGFTGPPVAAGDE